MQISDSFKVFLLLSGGLILANLLIMNDVTTFWNMVESDFLLKVQSIVHPNVVAEGLSDGQIGKTISIPLWQTAGWVQLFGFSEFNVRLIGVIVLLLGALGFYFFGKKIFGKKPTLVALLVAGSSFLPVNLIKFASADAWLLTVEVISFLFLLLYLKQPINKWKWSFWVFVILGALVHPLSSFIWNLGLWGYLQIFHPQGKRLSQLWLLPLLGVLYLPLWYFGHLHLHLPYFFMGIGSDHADLFFPLLLIGILPWFGFLPAALWDMFQKLRKKEEMAIINLGWILFGIFSQSMVVFVGLAFIIGKQLLAYFQKNYPYSNLVKTASLLNMIFTFCALVVFMLNGYVALQAIGYSSLTRVSAAYWMMSFAGVLGLFLRSNHLVTGGMAMSGILSTLVFWIMVNPLLESNRNLPQQIYQNMSLEADGSLIQLRGDETLYVHPQDSISQNKNLLVYLNEKEIQLELLDASFDISQNKNTNKFIFLSEKQMDKLPDNHFLKKEKGIEIVGGTEYLGKKNKYQLFYVNN